MPMDERPYEIEYEFRFKDGRRKFFKIVLDPETINMIRPELEHKPEWTRLDHEQCTCCPLKQDEYPYCPIALNIEEVVEEFKSMYSYDDCDVRCTTPERTYFKRTSLMEGLSSIFGIIMATSECPVMEVFKPMARFHLPFSTAQETVMRSASIYLLRQYFEHISDKPADLDLQLLDEHYKKVKAVNEGFMARINSLVEKDADKNAINILNSYAQMLSMQIYYSLNSLEYLFRSR
jgi:hypothetical protein